MRKLSVLLIIAAASALALGCASSGAAQQQAAAQAPTAPAWLPELPPEDAMWGIGIAKLQNESLAMQTATSRARRAVAEQLSVLTQGMLTDYARESGTINNSTSIQAIENIGRDLVDTNLSGAQPNARERMPDGTWWVRVSLNKADGKKAINDVVENEASRYADFKASEALKMLDAKLAETKSNLEPRTED